MVQLDFLRSVGQELVVVDLALYDIDYRVVVLVAVGERARGVHGKDALALRHEGLGFLLLLDAAALRAGGRALAVRPVGWEHFGWWKMAIGATQVFVNFFLRCAVGI